jgi:hypothetical protein
MGRPSARLPGRSALGPLRVLGVSRTRQTTAAASSGIAAFSPPGGRDGMLARYSSDDPAS